MRHGCRFSILKRSASQLNGSTQTHRHKKKKKKKIRVSASAEEMMVAMFWDSDGVILTHCVAKGTTVTGAY
jgi:hypothetical protein